MKTTEKEHQWLISHYFPAGYVFVISFININVARHVQLSVDRSYHIRSLDDIQ